MYKDMFNRGFLFNHFPQMLLAATNDIKSDSDFMVKVARAVKNDPLITHDHQIFRQFRAGAMTEEALAHYFGSNPHEFTFDNRELQEVNPHHIGGWYIVKAMILGLRQRGQQEGDYCLDKYCNFVGDVCDLEYSLIRQVRGKREKEHLIHDYFHEWLTLESYSLEKPTGEQGARYLAYMVMLWAALFELLIEEAYPEVGSIGFELVLPTVSQKKGQYVFNQTNNRLIELFKHNWARDKHGKPTIPWTTLYTDILRAQKQDPNLTGDLLEPESLLLLKPDVSAIKKRFDRWRKGALISVNDFRTYFAILRTPYAESGKDFRLGFILFTNIVSHIQLELLNAKTSPELICSLFGEYPKHYERVKERFRAYKETGDVNLY